MSLTEVELDGQDQNLFATAEQPEPEQTFPKQAYHHPQLLCRARVRC